MDGGFDLFSSGHIEFLRAVARIEDDIACATGWHNESNAAQRIKSHGEDYPSSYVIAGVHDDGIINKYKGSNYPIMNVYERGLCVLQCKVSRHWTFCCCER